MDGMIVDQMDPEATQWDELDLGQMAMNGKKMDQP